jgi:NAD+ kinase
MNVAIVGQRGNDRAVELCARLARRLRADDVGVAVDETTARAFSRAGADWAAVDVDAPESTDTFEDCALVVSVGGDGTFLYVARRAGSTPILGVNLGEVGFLNAVAPAVAVETVLEELERIRTGADAEVQTMARIAARGDGWSLEPAINEVVVQGPRRGHGGGAEFTVEVNGGSYADVIADGVMVATPTGSTAYNMSEGGPLVHPDVSALVLTGLAPADGLPSLVVDGSDEITVEVREATDSVAVSDGRVRQRLDPPAAITLEVADEPVRVAGPSRNFYAALGKLE